MGDDILPEDIAILEMGCDVFQKGGAGASPDDLLGEEDEDESPFIDDDEEEDEKPVADDDEEEEEDIVGRPIRDDDKDEDVKDEDEDEDENPKPVEKDDENAAGRTTVSVMLGAAAAGLMVLTL